MGTDKHLKLRATPDSALGRVITHLQNGPTNQQELAAATLLSRFLPFAMDKKDSQFREIAIRSANECEAWARAIREYAGLGTSPSFLSREMEIVNHTHNHTHNQDNENDKDNEKDDDSSEEIDPELEQRKRGRRAGNMGL